MTNIMATAPLYDLIIGKQTLHDIGAILDFQEKTITKDGILLPMRNIINLQHKPSVTRALRHNTYQAQEPISTQTATKRVIEILDAKYVKADLPAIVKDNCTHLTPLQREELLSLLLKYESLFDGTLGDWDRPPISVELKEGVKPYHCRPYPIPQIHKATLMKEKWFQLPLSGYVQRVGFYTFLIHSSTLSEVVFCTTSAYLCPSICLCNLPLKKYTS